MVFFIFKKKVKKGVMFKLSSNLFVLRSEYKMHGMARITLISQMSASTVCVLVFDRLCRNGCTMAMYLIKRIFMLVHSMYIFVYVYYKYVKETFFYAKQFIERKKKYLCPIKWYTVNYNIVELHTNTSV